MTDAKKATLKIDGKEFELPVIVGTEGEVGVDVTSLRNDSGAITLDPAYGNTASCESRISFIDGAKGILRYRGYPIEELAENAQFDEVIYLLLYGELPSKNQLDEFRGRINEKSEVDPGLLKILEAFPKDMHPMAMLSALTVSLTAYHHWNTSIDDDAIALLAKFKGLVAHIEHRRKGEEFVKSSRKGSYVQDFVHMMFGKDDEVLIKGFDQLLVLHADHEQNCSASTVRMVGSSLANLPASIAAGVDALWGPLHGGANQAVIEQLEEIQNDGGDVEKYVQMAKDKTNDFRLMGFGHRVYKNFDPRAKIIKKAADEILKTLGIGDEELDVARRLERVALEDDYFVSRKLYPNVDFYSGIIYRALGIPTDMFTVMFALGRLPGWISQWKEWREDPKARIHRPRQIYIGAPERHMK